LLELPPAIVEVPLLAAMALRAPPPITEYVELS
jgi:hypothetical protein